MNAEFVCHAYAKLVANVFTPQVQVFCQITSPAPGQYRITRTNDNIASGDLKVTISALKAGASLNKNLAPFSDAITDVVITDDAGVAAVADEIWVTIERVPRV